MFWVPCWEVIHWVEWSLHPTETKENRLGNTVCLRIKYYSNKGWQVWDTHFTFSVLWSNCSSSWNLLDVSRWMAGYAYKHTLSCKPPRQMMYICELWDFHLPLMSTECFSWSRDKGPIQRVSVVYKMNKIKEVAWDSDMTCTVKHHWGSSLLANIVSLDAISCF